MMMMDVLNHRFSSIVPRKTEDCLENSFGEDFSIVDVVDGKLKMLSTGFFL
jgi:hypothetical protein